MNKNFYFLYSQNICKKFIITKWEFERPGRSWRFGDAGLRCYIFMHFFISVSNPQLNFLLIVHWYTDKGKVISIENHNIQGYCLFVTVLRKIPGSVLFYHNSETDYSWWQISDDRFVRKLKCPGVDIKGLSERSPLLTSEKRKLAMIYNFNWTLMTGWPLANIYSKKKNIMKGSKIYYTSSQAAWNSCDSFKFIYNALCPGLSFLNFVWQRSNGGSQCEIV